MTGQEDRPPTVEEQRAAREVVRDRLGRDLPPLDPHEWTVAVRASSLGLGERTSLTDEHFGTLAGALHRVAGLRAVLDPDRFVVQVLDPDGHEVEVVEPAGDREVYAARLIADSLAPLPLDAAAVDLLGRVAVALPLGDCAALAYLVRAVREHDRQEVSRRR